MDQHENNRICGDATENQRTEQTSFCKTVCYIHIRYICHSLLLTLSSVSLIQYCPEHYFFSDCHCSRHQCLLEGAVYSAITEVKKRCADQCHWSSNTSNEVTSQQIFLVLPCCSFSLDTEEQSQTQQQINETKQKNSRQKQCLGIKHVNAKSNTNWSLQSGYNLLKKHTT